MRVLLGNLFGLLVGFGTELVALAVLRVVLDPSDTDKLYVLWVLLGCMALSVAVAGVLRGLRWWTVPPILIVQTFATFVLFLAAFGLDCRGASNPFFNMHCD